MTIEIAPKKAETTLTVRRLNTGDVFTILTLLTDTVGSPKEIEELFTDYQTKEVNVTAVGMSTIYRLISGLMAKNREKVLEWLGSLVTMTGKEFEQLPPTALLQVCTALNKHEDLGDFLAQCSEAWSQFTDNDTESEDQETEPNTSPDSTTESQTGTDGQTQT